MQSLSDLCIDTLIKQKLPDIVLIDRLPYDLFEIYKKKLREQENLLVSPIVKYVVLTEYLYQLGWHGMVCRSIGLAVERNAPSGRSRDSFRPKVERTRGLQQPIVYCQEMALLVTDYCPELSILKLFRELPPEMIIKRINHLFKMQPMFGNEDFRVMAEWADDPEMPHVYIASCINKYLYEHIKIFNEFNLSLNTTI